MNKRDALARLKRFWTENQGDYLHELLQIKKELPKGHKSAKSLEEEIQAVEGAYSDFLLWRDSVEPKRRRKKS